MIRSARLSDAEALLAFIRSLVEEPHNNMLIASEPFRATILDQRRMIEGLKGNSFLLVAEEEGLLKGCLTARGGQRPCNRHEVVLGVAVHRDYRNQGIGTRLMRSAIARAREKGLRRIELTVYARNTAAIRLYERLGFEREGVRRRAYLHDGEWIDAVLMGMLLD